MSERPKLANKFECRTAVTIVLAITLLFSGMREGSADGSVAAGDVCNPMYYGDNDITPCIELAESGNLSAAWMLGLRYNSGWGVTKNLDLAQLWWERAAEQGYAYAQLDLARLYLDNYWSANADKVIELFTAAANNPDATDRIAGEAAGSLGRIFYYGFDPVEKQPTLAAEWIGRGIQLNDVQSHYLLGELYLTGTKVPQSYHEARHWWSLAAERGSISAQHRLGQSLNNELHGPLDLERSVYWLSRAAANRNVWAQRDLSRMYELGRGVESNMELAHMWMNIAGALSEDWARDAFVSMRDELATDMSTEQIARAQAMAINCLESGLLHADCNIPDVPPG